MTHNLAISLKHHSPNVKIHLFVSEELNQYVQRPYYDTVKIIPNDSFTDHRGIAPVKIKAKIYELGLSIGLDSFLYLDVDAVCLNDISSWFESLKGSVVATEVLGRGGINDKIDYSIWASNRHIFDFFNLDNKTTLCGIQSSWAYFERSKVCDKMQEYLNYYLKKGFPFHKLTMHWGGAIPDELLYQGVYAKMGIIPKSKGFPKVPVFFGHKKNKKSPNEVKERFYLLSMYGNGTGQTLTQKRWFKLYDEALKQITKANYYPHDRIMRDKFANRT